MRRTAFILSAAMSLVLAGCVLNGQQAPKVSATPPPPKPAATATPAAAPPPALSIPQTTAQLPAPQPISAEALATVKVEGPAETPPSRPPRRAAATPARAEPTPPPVAAQTPPAPPPEPERPALQEILPPAESKRLQESAVNRKREIKRVLDQAEARKMSESQRAMVARIRTFVQQSDEAEGRGEMRLADALAERAQVLVRELQGGR